MENTSSSPKSTQTPKVFADGVWIRQKTFSDGASILKFNVSVEKFTEFLKKNRKGDGFVNLIIRSRKEVKENGESHYAYVDDWVPSVPTAPKAATPKKTVAQKPLVSASVESSDDDGIL